MARSLRSSIELLESRIAPAALTVLHAPPDIVAGVGKTGATIDLGNMFDQAGTYHTMVTFHTNFDSDPTTPGIQGDITIELYDDTAPLTVQDFLSYASNPKTGAGFLGTFFHRAVLDSSNVNHLSLLQGGGFDAPNFAHIATGAVVHNEAGISNTAGTIALAKVAGDPNSGTNEFFINLGDNSQTLDAQNGGFAVFGKLTDSSLLVAQKIAALTLSDLTPSNPASAFTQVPTQAGYSTTSGKLPTAAQLVTITGVQVDAPLRGNSPGIAFQVSVTNPGLATPTLVGDKLTLAYKPGVSGVSTVTVNASNGTDSATEMFNVTVEPNLNVAAHNNLPTLIVPGDTGLAAVKLTDNGAAKLSGKYDVNVYLKDLGMDGLAPQLIGHLSNLSLSLASGASVSALVKLQLPTTLETNALEQYQIETDVVAAQGTTAPVTLHPSDQSFLGESHQKVNAFGTFGGRTNVAMTYADAITGHLVTMKLLGGGSGQIFVDAGSVLDLDFRNTTGHSAASAVVAGGGHTTLHQIDIVPPATVGAAANAFASLAFGGVDLTGNLFAPGGLKSLTLGNLAPAATDTASHSLQIGDFNELPGQKAAISLGQVTDYSLLSNEAIGALTIGSWHNVNASAEMINTVFLDSLVDKGDLEAGVNVSGAGLVKTFTVAGTLHNASVHVGGNVGAVLLGGMKGSQFLVGTGSIPTNRVPTFDAVRSIASFIVKGAAGSVGVMDNSTVAAADFGTVFVQSAHTDNGGSTPFGVIAHQIASYQRGLSKLSNLRIANSYDVQGDYSVKIV